MAFNWQERADEQGGGKQAPKLAEGVHKVKIVKVLHGTKNAAFVTDAGDKQILVIVADGTEAEASSMFTLNEKYGWALAKLAAACGMDLDRMTKAGIGPDRFADEAFASKNLVGKALTVEVEHSGKYANFTPVRDDDGTPGDAQVKDDDIPF